MKPLVIYHASCADGFGAAFAAWLKLGDEAEYLPVQYNEYAIEPMARAVGIGRLINQKGELLEVFGREVYILDFSFPREVMDWLFSEAKRVIWLDHHKTAFEMWCGGIPNDGIFEDDQADRTVVLDNNKSGAMLAWEYFHPGTEAPRLIKHIDDYDRWQFKLRGTKEINKALWSYTPWSFELWQNLINVEHYGAMIAEGAAILRAHNQNVQSVVKGAKRECIIYDLADEWVDKGLAANCPPHLTSDVGHALATESGTFGLCWYLNKDGKCLCSLRSNGGYDVSAIAKAFGGGGHRNAAGFEVPIATLLGWLK